MPDAIDRLYAQRKRKEREERERQKQQQQRRDRARFDDEAPPQSHRPPTVSTSERVREEQRTQPRPPVVSTSDRLRPATTTTTSTSDRVREQQEQQRFREQQERKDRKKDKKSREPAPRVMYDVQPRTQVGLTTPEIDTGPTDLTVTQVSGGWTPATDVTGQFTEGPETRDEAKRRGWRPIFDIGPQPLTQLRPMGPEPPPLVGAGFVMQKPLEWGGVLIRNWNQYTEGLSDPATQNTPQQGAGLSGGWTGPEPESGSLFENPQQTAAYERFRYDVDTRAQDYASNNQGMRFDPAFGQMVTPGYQASDYSPQAAGLGGGYTGDSVQLPKPLAWLGMQAGNAMSFLQAGQDWINTRTLPTGERLGPTLRAAVTPDPAAQNTPQQGAGFGGGWTGTVEQNAVEQWLGRFNQNLADFREATTPTAAQRDANTPEELRKIRERSLLNWADPEAVARTYDVLADRETTAQNLYSQAQEWFQQGSQAPADSEERNQLWAKAADAYAQAYELEHKHPIALVNENTNIGAQLLFEIFQPDLTDIFGGIVGGLLKLSPAERRLARVGREIVDSPATETAEVLSRLNLGPTARIATGTEARGALDQLWQTLVGTVGSARADIAADTMLRTASTLLSDVDTAGDARILLTTLARNPAQLLEGLPANLFQSAGLLARADSDGIIRFGSMGMNTKNFREALNSFRAIADEYLANSSILNRTDGVLNRPDLIAEFADAVQQGGYKYYKVAKDAAATYGNIEAATSPLFELGRRSRAFVSPFFIYLSPGTWATNIIGAAATTLGDGTLLGRPIAQLRDRAAKLYGGMSSSLRSLEGAASGSTFAGQLGGGILAPLKKAYGSLDEWFGDRVFLNSADRAMRRFAPQVVGEIFGPVLQAAGITDPRQVRQIVNRLSESFYTGENPLATLNQWLSGRTKAFNLSDVNPLYIETLDPQTTSELYRIIDTATDPVQAQSQIDKLLDGARTYYENLLREAPPPPTRHAWQQQEVAQDLADIDQLGRLAQQYGVPPEMVQQFRQASSATMQEINSRLQTLTNMVAESADPQNRYLLYNIWGQMYDKTTETRFRLAEAAERAYDIATPATANQVWGEYFQTAQRLWTERHQYVNNLLEQGAVALGSGQRVTADFGVWDILERTARTNEQRLWDTLRLEPQSGKWDERLEQVIEAGRQLTDRAVARVYAAARRFDSPSVMDHIISAERNTQIAGAQARAYLDQVLRASQGKWEDYFSTRNEVWRQLREYEQQVWGLAERSIVEDGLNFQRRTGLNFDAGPDGTVELLYPTKRRIETPVRQRRGKGGRQDTGRTVVTEYDAWVVRRQDGSITIVTDASVPAELKTRYRGLSDADIDAEVQMELDNIASAQPLAEDAQRLANQSQLEAGMTGVWRTEDGEQPVRIIRRSGPNFEGIETYRVQLSDGSIVDANMNELYAITNGTELRALTDIDEMRQARQVVDMTDIEAVEQARLDMRKEWDAKIKAKWGGMGLDTYVAKYYRNGVVNIPDTARRIEDIYGTTVAGRLIDGQEDLEAFILEYANLKRQGETLKRRGAEAQRRYVDAFNRREEISAADAERIRRELNFGNQSNVQNFEESARVTTRNQTAAGGVQPPEMGLGAAYSLHQIENLREFLKANLGTILAPTEAISEGQRLRILDAFRRQVIPALDNVRVAAAEYGNQMRSFGLIDFTNRTRLDEIMGLVIPYGFWFTRSVKNAAERMVFEPQVWRRVMQTEQAITDIREQRGDPQRFDGAVPITVGDKTFYLRVAPSKYWPTFPIFIQNDYANPESANNAYSFAVESMRSTGLNPYPWVDAAAKAAQGQAEDIYPANYLGALGGMAAAAAAFFMGSETPRALQPNFFEYNTGRELTLMLANNVLVDGEPVTAEEIAIAQDMARQMKSGEDPLQIQAQYEPRVQAILNEATRRAALNAGTASATQWTTGVTARPFDPMETQVNQQVDTFFNRGDYDPTTAPYADPSMFDYTQQQFPAVGARLNQGSIINLEEQRPGMDVVIDRNFADRDAAGEAINNAANAAGDAAIDANPNIRSGEIYAAKLAGAIEEAKRQTSPEAVAQFLAENPNATIGSLVTFTKTWITENLYPDMANREAQQRDDYSSGPTLESAMGVSGVTTVAGERDYTTYNPVTRREHQATDALYDVSGIQSTAQYPGEGAGRAQWDADEAAQEQEAIRRLTDLGYTEEEARAQWEQHKNRFRTEKELNRLEEIEREWAVKDAQFAARRDRVNTDWGEEAGNLFDQYLSLPKDSEARLKFRQEHPEIRLYMLSAYNPDEWAAAQETLPNRDDWTAWVNAPPYGEGTEAERAARSKYWDAHPGAFVVHSYMNGRPGARNDEMAGEDDAFTWNWGADYATAQEMFGDDIWAIVAQYRRGWSKQQKRAFYDKYPQYGEWQNWWYANMPNTGQMQAAGQRRSGPGYDSLGHRAYGSWGGGGWGGGGGGGGGGYVRPIETPFFERRGLAAHLWEAPGGKQWRPWFDNNLNVRNPAPPSRIIRTWR